MKTSYIVAGGFFDGFFDQIDKEDLLIAADKGYVHLEKINLRPNLIIGDFDSAKEPDFSEKIVLNKEKDMTDTYAAVEYAINLGYKKIIIYGCFGGRLSHTIANIKMIQEFKEKGIDIILKSKYIKAFLLDDYIYQKFEEDDDYYVSVFSLKDISKNVSIRGLKYELDKFLLKSNNHLGVSNETKGVDFEISVEDGLLLVIYESKKL